MKLDFNKPLYSPTGRYGVYDPVDNVWMGNDAGPVRYDDPLIARLVAELLEVQVGLERGRLKAREYDCQNPRLRDSIDAKMKPEEAIRRMEEGLV